MPAPASAPGSETNTRSQKAEQMKAAVQANGRTGHSFSLIVWYHPWMGKSATTWRQLLGLPGNQSLGPGLPMALKGSFSFENRRERMGPEAGVAWMGWHLNQITHLCVAASVLIAGR